MVDFTYKCPECGKEIKAEFSLKFEDLVAKHKKQHKDEWRQSRLK